MKKEATPDQVKIKKAIRVMVKVALKILEPDSKMDKN